VATDTSERWCRVIDAHRIASKLWMGSYPKDPQVCDGRFGLIVLAASEHPELPFRCQGQEVLRVPLWDAKPMDDEVALARRAAQVVDKARRRGERVLVTCAQGVNRSGLIVALALVLEGMSADGAVALVRSQRKHPAFKPLFNAHFVSEIERFARKRLRTRRDSARATAR